MSAVRQTILVVDDDEEVIDLLASHFKKRNAETIATADPATVVDKLKNFSISLMLLDLKMRRLDGFEVLEKIKEASLSLPPTLVITGYLPKYLDRLKAHGIHPEDVITKPFDFDVLEAVINRKLGEPIVASGAGSEYEDKLYQKNRCTIGFVEDEEDLLETLSGFFKERNYTVFSFKDGLSALKALRRKPVDILLVDIKLPGLSGDQLIAEIAKLPKRPHMLPMSADPLPPEMAAKLKGFGCGEFVEKPFDIAQIIERIKTIAVKKGLLGGGARAV